MYEPKIPADSEFLLPDWLLLPQCGIDKPVIVEYWGLLRKENRADWVAERLPKYFDKKKVCTTAFCFNWLGSLLLVGRGS